MNTQEIGFSEIMEGLTLLFIAALLLGFTLLVGKIIYMSISDYIEKKKTKNINNYKKKP